MDLDILIRYMIFVFLLFSTIWLFIYSIIGFIELQKIFPTERKETIRLLWKYIPEITSYLEQMRKRDNVDKLSLRALGESKLKEMLMFEDMDISISEWEEYIEVLIESNVGRLDKFDGNKE